jgi:hypothetical protein
MNGLRRWSLLVCACVLSPLWLASLHGDDRAEEAKAEDKWFIDRALTVSARLAPAEALKYRLFPLTSERKDGNAVPMYLRFAQERPEAAKRYLYEHCDQWKDLPLEQIPLAEAHVFLDRWKYNLKQLELGARRKSADWNYALDAGSLLEMILPEVQDMRYQARLLLVKARVETAEGHLDEALRTFETGFSFCQQLAEASFLVSGVVAIWEASRFAAALPDLMGRPDAPNLYWALTAMPRPLISLRNSMEQEQRSAEKQFPDLAELDRPHSPEQWDAALARVRKEAERLRRMQPDLKNKPPAPGTTASDPAARSPDLPAAKKYLTEVVGMKAAALEKMTPAEMLLRWIYGTFKEQRDDLYKATYLPFSQAWLILIETMQRQKELPANEAVLFAHKWNLQLHTVLTAQVRLERQLAALRVIEALRIHAVSHGGDLPTDLGEVMAVPLPEDPGTGRPFEYHREGTEATLICHLPGRPREEQSLRYRLTIRR